MKCGACSRKLNPYAFGSCRFCGTKNYNLEYYFYVIYKHDWYTFKFYIPYNDFYLLRNGHSILCLDYHPNITPFNAKEKLPTLLNFK
jgi:hypothetical protein